MMGLAFYAVVLAATALAWTLARRRPEHRPVAVLLSVAIVADVAVHLYDVAVIAPLRAELGLGPWTGWARAASVLYNAAQLAYPAILVATVLHVFKAARPWLAAIGWTFAVAYFVVAHPVGGDGSQARALTIADAAAATVALAVVVRWYARARQPATSAQYAMALIASAELASLIGAWRVGPFAAWPVSQVLYVALYAALALVQGRYLWTSPRLQPSS
jgi:hypothetical protein